MGKVKILKVALLFVVSIMMLNCKDANKNNISNGKTEITEKYREVSFTKDFKRSEDISELNVKYKNYTLKFRFIQDITLFQFGVGEKIVSNWKEISFNFQYLPDNYDGIRLLFNENNSKGILLLPGYTEEFPNLIGYEFDQNHFLYFNDLDIKYEELKRITFKSLNDEWRKGSFEISKKNNNYILTFHDASKKNLLNFENSQSNNLLSATDLKKYIDLVLQYEKRDFNNQYNLEKFKNRIEKEGFKKVFEKECDLNNDKIQDKILVFSTELPENFKPSDYEESIVCVYISGKLFQNKNIISKHYVGDVAIGFSDIKIKDNYFTIEQVNGGGDAIVQEYTTFKLSHETNTTVLHKYSRSEILRSEGDGSEKSYNYNTKNFGNILFEDYNSETILYKCIE